MSAEHILYYCPRINLLKLYGPVIAEQLRRGGPRPLLAVPGRGLMTYGAKNRRLAAGLFLDGMRGQLGSEVGVEVVESARACLDLIAVKRVGAVVNLGMRLPVAIRQGVLRPSRTRGVRWCALGYIQEELFHLLEDDLDGLDDWDVLTTLSEAGLNAAVALLKERGVADVSRASRLVPIGFVELDQVEGFDRAALRRKHGIPADRPVIYFCTDSYRDRDAGQRFLFSMYASGVVPGSLARAIWRGRFSDADYLATYSEILQEVRRFARRHGAYLIAKTRAKDPDPMFLRRAVDRVFSDSSYYPFTMLELIHLADCYVGMPSASAIEAAFIGRRMTHVLPYPPEFYEYEGWIPMRRAFYADPGGLWNAPGFSQSFRSYTRGGWEAFKEWAATAPLATEVDPAVRQAVVRKVIGFDDFKASARFLELVESALGEERR